MGTEKIQSIFNLKILKEGLSGLAAESDEQMQLNKFGMENLDDVFDVMVKDYLPYLEENKILSITFCNQIRAFYERVVFFAGHLSDQEKDAFIKENSTSLISLRDEARNLLIGVNAALVTLDGK